MVEVGRVTAIIDGDISALTSKLNQARSLATTSVAGIEHDLKSGFSKSLSGGDLMAAGKNLGNNLVSGISSSFGVMGSAVGEVATALGPTGMVAAAALAGAAVIGSAASAAAMEWEAGMSQISKTTGIEKGSTGFAALSGDLKDLYSTMPTTVSEIQGVAAAAGSLGIAQGSIAGFTEVALQMGSAFDMPAEQAAVAMGKIKGQVKSFPDDVKDAFGKIDDAKFAQNMGSAIDYVGNNFNATEKDVLDFSTRTAGSLSALGGNVYEIAGWGGMLSSVFPSAERAAGSFDSLLTNLTTNTEAQTAASDLLGISVEEFMQSMTKDPSQTLLNIGSALEGLPTDKLMTVTKDLGGAYGMDVLTKMVGHTEEWRSAIEATVAAGQKGESIGTSFTAGAQSAKAGLQVLKNSIGAILTDIGGPINDVMSNVGGTLAEGLNKVREIGENLWEPLTEGLSPLTEGITAVVGIVGTLGGMTLDGLVTASKGINTAFQTGKVFVSAFKEELTKIIENSSTFQTLSGYVTQVSDAFSSLGAKAEEVWDKIVSGLSDAIPTAISGTIGALGTLMDKAGLGGVADAFGSVGGFFGDVYDNAAKKLGWDTGDAIGDAMADGIKKNDDLKNAPGNAVKAGKDGAVAAGKTIGEDAAKAFADSQKAWLDRNAAYVEAGYNSYTGKSWTEGQESTTGYAGLFGRGTVDRIVEDQGINYKIRSIATKYDTEVSLYVDGQLMASGKGYGSKEEALKDLFGKSGFPLSEATSLKLQGRAGEAALVGLKTEIATDVYLNFAENLKTEMARAGEEIGDAFAAGIVPDADKIATSLESLRNLRLYDPEEARAQGADNAIAYLEAVQDSLDSYEKAKAEYLLEPDNERAEADMLNARNNLQAKLAANPLKIEVKSEWGTFDTKSFSELIMDPVAVKNAATDINRFFDGTIVPGIKNGMAAAKSAFDSGQITQAQVYDNLIKPLEQYADYLPGWIEDMNAMFKSGQIDIDDYIYLLDQMTGKIEKTTEKVKDQTVGYDNLKKAVEGCSECAVSDFEQWQEAQDGLFQGSYIGQGGQAYLDWKTAQVASIAATQEAMRAVGGSVLGQDYTQSSLLNQQIKIDADTSPAETAKLQLETSIKESKPQMSLQIETTEAMGEVNKLLTYIIQANPVMSVQVSVSAYADEIYAMVDSAIRSALA